MVTNLHQPRGPGEAAQRHRDLAAGDEYSTVQYSTAQYSTVQYSTVQYLAAEDEGCKHHGGHPDTQHSVHQNPANWGVVLSNNATVQQGCFT